jgi:hypothetical protein
MDELDIWMAGRIEAESKKGSEVTYIYFQVLKGNVFGIHE